MSLAIVYSRAKLGVEAPQVTVEVHLSNGLPSLNIVGLPETAVKESKDRVRSALINSHLEFPARRITVNLAPADLPKDGGRFDLPIAIGILAASGQIPAEALAHYEFLGELALSGELRAISAALPATIACHASQRKLIISADNGSETALVTKAEVYSAPNLLQVCAHLHGRSALPAATITKPHVVLNYPELADVRGQPHAKRALEIAASGGHNLLLFGPPGTGKTMLASRLPGILPPLGEPEALSVATVYSVAGLGHNPIWQQRPFRAPHHTSSAVALVGGGAVPRPGEISLAHCGVLFLDELPEFQRQVLEVLREPLESGEIRISRAKAQTCYPAHFQLIAAMNPCPCGYHGSNDGRCHCTAEQVKRYRQKISGPLLDRIDMHVPVNTISTTDLFKPATGESNATIGARVLAAHNTQLQRQQKNNHQLTAAETDTHCVLQKADKALLEHAIQSLGLSIRAYHRVLKVARTLADMDNTPMIARKHITEALGYRSLDRPLKNF